MQTSWTRPFLIHTKIRERLGESTFRFAKFYYSNFTIKVVLDYLTLVYQSGLFWTDNCTAVETSLIFYLLNIQVAKSGRTMVAFHNIEYNRISIVKYNNLT